MLRKLLPIALLTLLSGCVSIKGINEDFRTVDDAWSIENEQYKSEHYPHRVNANFDETYEALKQAFLDLDMQIDKESREKGFFTSKNQGHHPLSAQQWAQVREVENPKLRKLVGWMMTIKKNPDKYFITIKASAAQEGEQTSVSLDYYLEMPDYEDIGIIPSRQAPPSAIKLGSEMIFDRLDANLSAAN